MIVVAWAIEIGRHRGVVADAILATIELAQLAGNLGNRIGSLVGRVRQQRALLYWLLSNSWGDAGTAEKQQALDSGTVGFMDGILGDRQILKHELCRIGVVSMDAPHARRRSQRHPVSQRHRRPAPPPGRRSRSDRVRATTLP